MTAWISIFAEYFICWWITLFVVLPFGLRTQAEENSVVNGTVQSAPARFRPLRVFLTTTVVAAIFYSIWYYLTAVLGLNALSIPRIVPEFQ
jgi:predicted secreted protein